MTEPENKIKVWIVLSSGGDGMPIAYHLQQEGNKVIVGQIQDKKELGEETGEKEEPEDRKERLLLYDSILKKYPARTLVNALKKVKNKDDYFIFCEHNNLFKYSEELLNAGFTKGVFPTKKDFEMEKERETAMDFVEKNYDDVQIIPHQKVKTVEEARKVIEESDVPLVVQSEGDFCSTVVGPDDVEQSKEVLLSALEKNAKEYSKGEIIIKEKLIAPIEITPAIVFWNGEPVFTDIDIETKNIGNGENNGPQVGCGSNLIIRTELDDEINKIAFPPKVYEIAKEHTGIFYWDISLYLTETGIYFGEFCSNRPGYDALPTEMTMAHGPSEYFYKIMEGKSPLEDSRYGAAVRFFNLGKVKDQEVVIENWKPVWLYSVRGKGEKFLTTIDCWDSGVVTGRGNEVEEAISNLYENYEGVIMKDKYSRTKEDFLADYPTSIMKRYNETKDLYYGT